MGRPSARLFITLLAVALPPLVAFAAVVTFAGAWLLDHGYGAGTQLVVGAAVTALWAGVVAIVAARVMAGEARSMLELAQRGAGEGDPELSEAQRRLIETLDERNAQIAALAEMVRQAPIADDPAAVSASMAGVARTLTGDPTWILAVLRGTDDSTLPPGLYGDPTGAAAPVDEVHRWASTLQRDEGGVQGARYASGPWGAFAVVDVAAGEELRAILMAPWEGRPPPSPAELGLLSLLGQHAATAVEHAILYTRLRSQADELNRLAAIQSDFLRGVTHDLQTPLTSIRALAAELRDSLGSDAAAHADLDTIAHQADRLRRMVSQLLVASRLEAGALQPRQEVFRIEPIVRRTWAALRADRPLELVVEGPEHLAIGDPDRLEQVLWAILDNAVKYSPPGTTITVRLRASAGPAGGDPLRAHIEVADQGSGMDTETRDRAFEQFYRSQDARRLAPDGSGVGLYAARGLMEAMEGSIAVQSQLGAGSTVIVELPAESAASDMEVPASQRTP